MYQHFILAISQVCVINIRVLPRIVINPIEINYHSNSIGPVPEKGEGDVKT